MRSVRLSLVLQRAAEVAERPVARADGAAERLVRSFAESPCAVGADHGVRELDGRDVALADSAQRDRDPEFARSEALLRGWTIALGLHSAAPSIAYSAVNAAPSTTACASVDRMIVQQAAADGPGVRGHDRCRIALFRAKVRQHGSRGRLHGFGRGREHPRDDLRDARVRRARVRHRGVKNLATTREVSFSSRAPWGVSFTRVLGSASDSSSGGDSHPLNDMQSSRPLVGAERGDRGLRCYASPPACRRTLSYTSR